MSIKDVINSPKTWWLAVILYMGVIFFLSSIPGKDLPLLFPFSDKVIHLVEYGILGFLLRKAINFYFFKYPGVLAVLIGALYGLSDEIHQIFVPGRECNVVDWIFDVAGCTLSQVLFRK